MRELNKNEFMVVRRGLEDARDLRSRGYLKDALFALKRPKKILEYGAQKTRMLALVYLEESGILAQLGKTAQSEAASHHAQAILDAIGELPKKEDA